MAHDFRSTVDRGASDADPHSHGPSTGARPSLWELLPPEMRVLFVTVGLVICTGVAVAVQSGFSSMSSSFEEYREMRGSDYATRPDYVVPEIDKFEPRKVRKERGIVCSVFGSLLRRPASCE